MPALASSLWQQRLGFLKDSFDTCRSSVLSKRQFSEPVLLIFALSPQKGGFLSLVQSPVRSSRLSRSLASHCASILCYICLFLLPTSYMPDCPVLPVACIQAGVFVVVFFCLVLSQIRLCCSPFGSCRLDLTDEVNIDLPPELKR